MSLHEHPAAIEPAVLQWAILRAKAAKSDVASAAGTSEAVVDQWLAGTRKPSFRQARSVADRLRLPFGFLFLATPPPDSLPIPDLRTVGNVPLRQPSVDLRDVILATLRKQDWLSEWLRESGASPVGVVGVARDIDDFRKIAADVARRLKIPTATGRPRRASDFLRLLVERAEALGVNVLRNGVVGNNTKRTLDVNEFRGFCLSDPYAPFIFINGADAAVAQIFTLLHELAHIWRGDTGVSAVVGDDLPPVELLCNRVASEILVPASEISAVWNKHLTADEAASEAARHFRTSRYVVAIKAFERRLIDRATLDDLLDQYRAELRAPKAGGGGDFYRTLISRNGKSFTSNLAEALNRQHVLVRDAAGLLDAKPSHLAKVVQEVRSG
jgi:Zn-dependent peptidase ImmA (M78 family)